MNVRISGALAAGVLTWPVMVIRFSSMVGSCAGIGARAAAGKHSGPDYLLRRFLVFQPALSFMMKQLCLLAALVVEDPI